MVDRVRPLKVESPSSGGSQSDELPSEVDIHQDYLDGRGTTYQNATSNDDSVRIERGGGDELTFTDPVSGGRTLGALLPRAEHGGLRELIHFLPEGPAQGFGAGAYKEIFPAASPFPSRLTWWTSPAKTAKIYEQVIARSGVFPTSIAATVYAADGATALQTVTDTLAYSGPFVTSVSRSIS